MHSSTHIDAHLEHPAGHEATANEGIDLIDLALPLLQAKRKIALLTTLSVAVGFALASLLKPVFTATAVIMPPQQQSSSAGALAGQLGALSALSGGGGAASLLKNPADMYVGILQSRLIADGLIDRYKLQAVYHVKMRMDARAQLKNNTEFEAAKDGLIYIHVKDHDPRRAADLANGYVDALHQTNSRLAIGEAAQRRMFYDQQLADERKALTAAEDDLKHTEETTGLIQLGGQAEMTMRDLADTRAEISSREVQLGAMRTFATDQNPQVTRLQQEIAALNSHLATLESAQQHMVPGDLELSGGEIPAASLEYLRKLREVRYHDALFELLAKQQAAAKLDEAKSAPVIQVVDPAEAPERKSGPSRVLIALGLGIAAFILSSVWTIGRSLLASMQQVPEQAARLEELRRAMRLR